MGSQKLDFFIIDDSDVNNYYTEDLLSEYEFTNSVKVFLNATDALNELLLRLDQKIKLPDVIFLDVRMPEMDGFEFIDELEQQLNDRNFPSRVFVLTSSKHKRDVESFEKQFIACEFMNKPLERGDFDGMIDKYFSDVN
jgi:CheY-like chemotaxis protein